MWQSKQIISSALMEQNHLAKSFMTPVNIEVSHKISENS